MTRNVELLERTMQHIVDHPEQHRQSQVWRESCGTPGCFIGWAMHFDGMTFQQYWDHEDLDVRSWAEEKLGLTSDEFGKIFWPSNSIPVLQLMVKDLVNGDEMRDFSEYGQALSNG